MNELDIRSNTQPKSFYQVQKDIEERQHQFEVNERLIKAFTVADTFLEQRYLDTYSAADIEIADSSNEDSVKAVRIYQISKVVFDPEEEINDKLISVYSALHNLESSVAIIIRSSSEEIEFYFATRSDSNPSLAGRTLHDVLKGNFPGIEISEILDLSDGEKRRELLNSFTNDDYTPKSLASVSLIPSERDEDNRCVQDFGCFRSINFFILSTASAVSMGINQLLKASD